MICDFCALEADTGPFGPKTSRKKGHGACDGCDCRHKPPGTCQPALDGVDHYTAALTLAVEGESP